MSLRLFIALHLSDDMRERLSRIQAALRSADPGTSVRWVEPESIHLTLRFLGESEEAAVPALVAALEAGVQEQRAVRLAMAGLGGFPNLHRPRVIWVGLEGDLVRLDQLQTRVESAVAASGWEPEHRAFQPHLTLGRVRDPRRPLDPRLMEGMSRLRIGGEPRTLRRLSLVRSHLEPKGSRYEDIAAWELDA